MCFNTNSRRTDVLAASPPPARHAATSKASRPTEKEQARRVRTTKKINIACSDDEIISKALALRTFIDQHVVQFYASQDEAMRLKAQRTIAIEVFHWANNQLDEDEHRKRQQQSKLPLPECRSPSHDNA